MLQPLRFDVKRGLSVLLCLMPLSAMATAVLHPAPGVTVILGPGAEAKVEEHPKDGSLLTLMSGQMRVLVRAAEGRPAKVSVKTRHAVMGVRGTEFFVDAGFDKTSVCTLKGVVVAVPLSSWSGKIAEEHSVVLRAGEGVVIQADGTVATPVPMDPTLMGWWVTRTSASTDDLSLPGFIDKESDWRWTGPTTVDAADPEALYSSLQRIHAGASLFIRGTQVNDRLDSHDRFASYRGNLNLGITPSSRFLFYAEGLFLAKSGNHNPDVGEARLQQGFALARLKSGHSLAMGRMEWDLGDSLLIGRDPWATAPRFFDGALATVRSMPLRLRVLGASLGDRVDSTDFKDFIYGASADFPGKPYEIYALGLRRQGKGRLALKNDQDVSAVTLGQRLGFNIKDIGFVSEEFAYQAGAIGVGSDQQRLSSFLGTADAGAFWRAGHRVAGTLRGVYLLASGDRDGGDREWNGVVPYYHNNSQFLGFVGVFPQIRNIQKMGASLTARTNLGTLPVNLKVDALWFHRWDTDDRLYPVVDRGAERYLGREVDVQLSFEPIPTVLLQWGYGIFSPGDAFVDDHPGLYRAFAMAQFSI